MATTTQIVRPFAAAGDVGAEAPVLLIAKDKQDDLVVDPEIWGDEQWMKRELMSWAKAVASMALGGSTTPPHSPMGVQRMTRVRLFSRGRRPYAPPRLPAQEQLHLAHLQTAAVRLAAGPAQPHGGIRCRDLQGQVHDPLLRGAGSRLLRLACVSDVSGLHYRQGHPARRGEGHRAGRGERETAPQAQGPDGAGDVLGQCHLRRRAEHAGWFLGQHRRPPPPRRLYPQGQAFFVGNTTAFATSLQIIVVLLDRKLVFKLRKAYIFITVALVGLVVAYVAGSCRETDTTVYLVVLVAACIAFQIALFILHHRSKKKKLTLRVAIQSVVAVGRLQHLSDVARKTKMSTDDRTVRDEQKKKRTLRGAIQSVVAVGRLQHLSDVARRTKRSTDDRIVRDEQKKKRRLRGAIQSVVAAGKLERLRAVVERRTRKSTDDRTIRDAVDKARSLVLLLATLAATITYQAGLNPPGGLWLDNGNGYMAGDPILLTTNAMWYKTFFYCNSIAFVTSLVAVVVVQIKLLLSYHVLEVAMVLDLFGLIGAYAAGSCRDISTSIHVLSLAGAVLVYALIHVVLFTLGEKDTDTRTKEDDELVEKTRKRLLLFVILAATITYQAGLTPPGGFRLQDDKSGHHAGDPVLLYNFPRRYHAFFYSNSVSFMLSIALIILLVNPHVYRPAIRTHALSVCTGVGLFALIGAYAAGSTQHLKTSIYIFLLVAVVLFFVVALLTGFLVKKGGNTGTINTETMKTEKTEDKRTRHAKRKYLMLLGILVASVTYQAGLTPPGGTWQSNGVGHEAGDPVMHDNRRARYLAFFYSNSASFAASIVVIILLLPKSLQKDNESLWLRAMNMMTVLDLLGLLGAYAAGTSRGWKTSIYVLALVFAVLVYIAVHVIVSLFIDFRRQENDTQPPTLGHSSKENSEQLANRSTAVIPYHDELAAA